MKKLLSLLFCALLALSQPAKAQLNINISGATGTDSGRFPENYF